MSAISSGARLQRSRMTPVVFFARYGFYVALLILILVFTALSPNFLTIPNGVNILQQTSTIGVMALGETLVILGGGVDVSVGSVLGLGGMVAAMVMRMPHASPLFAVSGRHVRRPVDGSAQRRHHHRPRHRRFHHDAWRR